MGFDISGCLGIYSGVVWLLHVRLVRWMCSWYTRPWMMMPLGQEREHGYMTWLTYHSYTLLSCISMVMFQHIRRGKGGRSTGLVPEGKGRFYESKRSLGTIRTQRVVALKIQYTPSAYSNCLTSCEAVKQTSNYLRFIIPIIPIAVYPAAAKGTHHDGNH